MKLQRNLHQKNNLSTLVKIEKKEKTKQGELLFLLP
jgi:hypothetical protein